ncbi:Uncharacterised protein [Mycobacteroides abscessus subsp. abscessus]|nr:Uncharacterised protein [Mycobacteroides abscessus subsp. abscessus]
MSLSGEDHVSLSLSGEDHVSLSLSGEDHVSLSLSGEDRQLRLHSISACRRGLRLASHACVRGQSFRR